MVQSPDVDPRDSSNNGDDRLVLEQQIRHLQERLAFYEGFDLLIQDNVTHARELFRLAAQERENATASADRARQSAGRREALLRAELQTVATELSSLSAAVDQLSRRVARALGAPHTPDRAPDESRSLTPVAVVVHGVPSARVALALQRFVAGLSPVSEVAAREFAAGVLRLEAQVTDQLMAEQFTPGEDGWRFHLLTERTDVIEFALEEEALSVPGGRRD